jgi:hypothetical protein
MAEKIRLGQTMDPPLPPEFRPPRHENLAARLRDYSGRGPASGSRVGPHRTWPGLGEVAAGRSRTAGEWYREAGGD